MTTESQITDLEDRIESKQAEIEELEEETESIDTDGYDEALELHREANGIERLKEDIDEKIDERDPANQRRLALDDGKDGPKRLEVAFGDRYLVEQLCAALLAEADGHLCEPALVTSVKSMWAFTWFTTGTASASKAAVDKYTDVSTPPTDTVVSRSDPMRASIGAPMVSLMIPSVASTLRCPSGIAPAWLPIAGTTAGTKARSARQSTIAPVISSMWSIPWLPTPTAYGRTCGETVEIGRVEGLARRPKRSLRRSIRGSYRTRANARSDL